MDYIYLLQKMRASQLLEASKPAFHCPSVIYYLCDTYLSSESPVLQVFLVCKEEDNYKYCTPLIGFRN